MIALTTADALTDRAWLWLSAGCYLASFLLGTAILLRRGRLAAGATTALILLGYAAQLAGLTVRGRAVGGCPLGNPFEVYQFTAWSAISLYLLVGVAFRKSLLGYFMSSLAAALTLVALVMPGWDNAPRARIFGNNPWVELHAALAVFSYGVFALLALTSVMFILRNHSLKAKRLGGWFSFLPAIRELDQIGLRLLVAGVGILAVSLGVGAVYWFKDFSSVHLGKLVITLTIWVAYAAALGLRLGGRLLAARFAWTTLALFAAALLSLGAVDRSQAGPRAPAAARAP
jgi:hypothetical protein